MTKRLGMGSQHWQDYRAREEQRKQEELAALNWATPGSEGWDMSGKTALSTPFLDFLPTRAITAPLAIAASVVKPIVKQATKKYRPHKYAGLSMDQKAVEVLKEFPQISGEGLKNVRAIVARGRELRKELPRVGKGKRLVRTLKARKDRAEATATAESIPSNLSPRQAHERAASRTRKTIDNLRKREFEGPSGGKSYWLTEADEKELYDQLYPIKLREVLEGTPHGRRMTISHHYPSLAALTRGGEQVGSGFANLANLTDEFGNFRFLTRSENASLGKVVPEIYLSTIKNLLNLK